MDGRDVEAVRGLWSRAKEHSPLVVSQCRASLLRQSSFSLPFRFCCCRPASFLSPASLPVSLCPRRDDVCGPFVAAARVDSLITPPRPFRPRSPSLPPLLSILPSLPSSPTLTRSWPAEEKGKKVPKIQQASPQIVFYECLHGEGPRALLRLPRNSSSSSHLVASERLQSSRDSFVRFSIPSSSLRGRRPPFRPFLLILFPGAAPLRPFYNTLEGAPTRVRLSS